MRVALPHPPARPAASFAVVSRPTQALLQGRYLHVQLTPKTWEKLEQKGAIPKDEDRHWQLSEDEWLEECLGQTTAPPRCALRVARRRPPPAGKGSWRWGSPPYAG